MTDQDSFSQANQLPILQALADQVLTIAKQAGIEQAEVSVGFNQGFSVVARQGAVETVEYHRDRAISLTVYQQQRSGTVSLSDTSQTAIQMAVQAATHIARYTESDPFAGLAEKEAFQLTYPQLSLAYPWALTVQEAIALACQCESQALAIDQHIVSAESVQVSTTHSWCLYANSQQFVGAYPVTQHAMNCALVAKQDNDLQRDDSYTISLDPTQLASVDWLAKEAARKVICRLGPRQLTTMTVPVVFQAEQARSLIYHFVCAISGGALYRQSSFLLDKLGQPIFADFINIAEYPHLSAGLGSAPFDQDGIITRPNRFIEKGTLVNYALSVYAARKLKMQTTANAGGTHNLTLQSGEQDLTGLLQRMGKGLLVTELIGQGVNLLTGDYSRGACGYWVERGEIQYPVHNITIASTLQRMYRQIIAIGTDVDVRGNIRTGSILIEEMTIAGT